MMNAVVLSVFWELLGSNCSDPFLTPAITPHTALLSPKKKKPLLSQKIEKKHS
jgi:hypothetical protein